jgi:hypothetical protein
MRTVRARTTITRLATIVICESGPSRRRHTTIVEPFAGVCATYAGHHTPTLRYQGSGGGAGVFVAFVLLYAEGGAGDVSGASRTSRCAPLEARTFTRVVSFLKPALAKLTT